VAVSVRWSIDLSTPEPIIIFQWQARRTRGYPIKA